MLIPDAQGAPCRNQNSLPYDVGGANKETWPSLFFDTDSDLQSILLSDAQNDMNYWRSFACPTKLTPTSRRFSPVFIIDVWELHHQWIKCMTLILACLLVQIQDLSLISVCGEQNALKSLFSPTHSRTRPWTNRATCFATQARLLKKTGQLKKTGHR